MISEDVQTINELIERLRLGSIEGSIEIVVNNKGKVNRIKLSKEKEKSEKKKTMRLEKPDLSHGDFSGLEVEGDFDGFDLHESDFSYSKIENSNLSGTNLKKASFYKAFLSQTDLSNTYGVDPAGSYMVGSVNLYNAGEHHESPVTNPYGADGHLHEEMDEEERAEHPVDMGDIPLDVGGSSATYRRRNY